jgi:hypothetical protein
LIIPLIKALSCGKDTGFAKNGFIIAAKKRALKRLYLKIIRIPAWNRISALYQLTIIM